MCIVLRIGEVYRMQNKLQILYYMKGESVKKYKKKEDEKEDTKSVG